MFSTNVETIISSINLCHFFQWLLSMASLYNGQKRHVCKLGSASQDNNNRQRVCDRDDELVSAAEAVKNLLGFKV